MKIETLAARAGHAPDATGAVAPPIHMSTTFEREPDGSYRAGYIYSRYANPNRVALEKAIAALEGGAVGLAFASGSAATMTLIQALGPGTHIVAPDDAYFGTTKLMREIFGPWGVEVTLIDMTDPGALKAAIRPNTRAVWIETPSNPLLRVTDIAAAVEVARASGALTVVDNTWGTPVLQRPLELGADIVMHSTTKYFGGHSDVLGGALVCRRDDELAARIRAVQSAGGAVPSPFECWLLLRGIRTLPVRVAAQCRNAAALAEHLMKHRAVEAVHYPGLRAHPGHEIARRQMSGFGAMLSVQVGGSGEAARAIASRLQLFTQATSLGGTESLVEHRASIEGPGTLAPANLLRISVGLEHAQDLIDDWEAALR
ncbi:MAG TPA: aminotransferase class V-fold PLP-dependent enzyme [Gemmatimonadaceae bacterium]|nr:aminotransferase class V-fold PLP-dependent enzyme [Gemmatimonadaceae bacterium]